MFWTSTSDEYIAAIAGALGEALGETCRVAMCPVFQIQTLLLCFSLVSLGPCYVPAGLIRSTKMIHCIVMNLINLSSISNQYLTTNLILLVVMGTSVHCDIFYKIMTPIKVHLYSPLLSNLP